MSSLPRSRPLTWRDLESMPDDGHRHELVDGALVVTPAPSLRHQQVAFRLARTLDETAGCPAFWTVDPEALELKAWELVHGSYAQVAQVGRGEAFRARVPFAVTVVPGELLD